MVVLKVGGRVKKAKGYSIWVCYPDSSSCGHCLGGVVVVLEVVDWVKKAKGYSSVWVSPSYSSSCCDPLGGLVLAEGGGQGEEGQGLQKYLSKSSIVFLML